MFAPLGFMGSSQSGGLSVLAGPTAFSYTDTNSIRLAVFDVPAGSNRLSVLLSNETRDTGVGDVSAPSAVIWYPQGTGTPGNFQVMTRTVTRGTGGTVGDTYHRAEEWTLANPTAGHGEIQVAMGAEAALGLVVRALSGVGGAPTVAGAFVEGTPQTAISTNITAQANSQIYDIVSASGPGVAGTPGAGQTEVSDADIGAADFRQYSSVKPSAAGGATTMSWSFAAIERAAQIVVAYSSETATPLGTQPTIRDVTFDSVATLVGVDDVFDVVFPTGVAAGDRVVIGLFTSKESASGAITSTITPPVITNGGAITALPNSPVSSTTGGRDVRLALWEVTWNGAETGNIVVMSTTRTGENSIAFAFAMADVRAGADWLENTPTPTTGADDPVTAPTPLTASNDNRLVVLVTGHGDDNVSGAASLGTFTGGTGADIPRIEEASSTTGADRLIAVHAVGLDTGSITGKSEATARTSDSWICVALIVRPSGP